jgi:hypothetical protein
MTTAVLIERHAIYDDSSLYCGLGLTASALTRARRSGQLRFTRQGTRILYMGEWVIDWLRSDCHPRQEVGIADGPSGRRNAPIEQAH